MDSDEIGSCILESLTELYEKRVVFPAQTSFHRYWYLHGFRHLFYDAKCCIPIDHETRSMTTFDDLFCWTSHIDIDPCDAISFDDLRGFGELRWILPEYLDDERILACVMGESFLLEILRVDESICRVEL